VEVRRKIANRRKGKHGRTKEKGHEGVPDEAQHEAKNSKPGGDNSERKDPKR